MYSRLRVIFCAGLLCTTSTALAQESGLLQINDPLHRLLLRQQTAGRLSDAHLSHLPLSAYEARRYLDSLDAGRLSLADAARQELDFYLGRRLHPNAARLNRVAGSLYRNGRSFFSASGDGFRVEVEPLLFLSYGVAAQAVRDEGDDRMPIWQNTRGARAAGQIGRHFFFETRLEETQRRDPRPRIYKKSVPRATLVRTSADSLYDYQIATGILGLRSRHFEVRFGRDRNRWGPATGGLLLSNYAAPMDQLQIRTTVWRLQYTNLFAGLTDLTFFPQSDFPDQLYPRKYAALHRLELNLPGRLQLGAFEALVFADDTTSARRRTGFDVSYLNPVIFYRAVEADRGSPDNALLGLDASWVAAPGLRVYSQFLLDELTLNLVGKKSWKNKWGWQLGAHVVAARPSLSLRAEYTRLRPFLYSHRWPATAYVHYNDILGHPAGPNAQDLAVFVESTPLPRLHLAADFAYTYRGRNTPEANYGSDPLVSYDTRAADAGVTLPFGVRQTALLLESRMTYELLPSLYAGGALIVSSIDDELAGLDRYVAPVLLLHWGLPFQSARY